MAVANLPEFTARVNAWAVKHATGLSMDVIQRKLVLDALLGVTNYTPVDTGYCRFNWLVSVNAPTSETQGQEGEKHTEYQPETVGQGVVAGKVPGKGTLPPWSAVYIQNNVEYAVYLNDGTPRIPANQMVERARGDILAELATPKVIP